MTSIYQMLEYEVSKLRAEVERLQVLYKDRGDLLDLKNIEIEQLRALLRRHHLRGAYWDHKLAVETRAALEKKS